MLVIDRKVKESLVIGDKIEIKVVEIQGGQVKLGIEAPRDIPVFRKELLSPEAVCNSQTPFNCEAITGSETTGSF